MLTILFKIIITLIFFFPFYYLNHYIKMQPSKLQFRIINCSTEDKEYPVSELYTSNP